MLDGLLAPLRPLADIIDLTDLTGEAVAAIGIAAVAAIGTRPAGSPAPTIESGAGGSPVRARR